MVSVVLVTGRGTEHGLYGIGSGDAAQLVQTVLGGQDVTLAGGNGSTVTVPASQVRQIQITIPGR